MDLQEIQALTGQEEVELQPKTSPPPVQRQQYPQIKSSGVAAERGDKKAEEDMLNYLDSVTGTEATAPTLAPKEQEKSVAAMFLDAALGLSMGPAQLWQNTKDTVKDLQNPDALAAERPYVKVGFNPAQQNASQVGSLFTSMGTGAMIGSTLGPIGAAIGGTVGALYGAFVANPTDGNIVDAAKALGVPVFDAMNKYSHSPTDTALDARLKNLAADGWLEAITTGGMSAGGTVLKSRRTIEAGKKAIKIMKEEFDLAKRSLTRTSTEVTEAEGQAALKAAAKEKPLAKPVADAAVNPESPAPAVVAAQEEAAQFEQFSKDKITQRKQDLEQVTGRPVNDNEVLESFEAEYGAKEATPVTTPAKQFTEEVIETSSDDVLKTANTHIDDVLPDAESPKYNTNAKADTREAVEKASWDIYSTVRRMFSPESREFAPIYKAADGIAKDPAKISAVIKKTASGEALTIEESAAVLIHSYDNTVSEQNAELLAKVMSGNATDAEVAAIQEGMNDIVSAYVAPVMLDAAEANTNSLKMGIRNYIKKYHEAGLTPEGMPIVTPEIPSIKSKMAAVNSYIEARGGEAIAAQDAGEFIKFVTEAAIAKEIPGTVPASIAKVLPRDLPGLVAHTKQVLAATSNELLAEALPKVAARSWGGKLADGLVSYRIKNMLNHWWTPVASAIGGVGDAGLRVTSNYLKLPYVGSIDLYNKVMRRDTPDMFMSNLKRANVYAEQLFNSFTGAHRVAQDAWKAYDPSATSVSYALDPLEKLAAKNIAADETVEAVQTSGGAFSFIKNGFWQVASLGERALFAWDRAIGTVVKEARFASEAAFEGYERGLRGAALDAYIKDPPAEIIAKYKDEALADANRFAYRGTPDIPLFKSLVDGHSANDLFSGAVRFLNPFLRPALLSMELVAEHMPGTNLLLPRTRAALASGDPNKIAEVMGKASAGALPIMGAMMAARNGFVSGPSKDFANFDDEGKRVPPFHMKVGSKWVPLEKVFGQGMITNFLKMGATMDSMFDHFEEGQYSAAFSLALFGAGETVDFSRFSIFGDLSDDVTRAAMGQMTLSQLSDKYALRNIPKSFLPGQRIAADLMASDVERQRVVTGEGLDFVTNALVQTFRETYTPEKLATRPNYLGEPAGRRSTFFYTFDTYSSGQEGGRSTVPLKVLRDVDAYAKLYSHLGVEQISAPRWPKTINDPTTGVDITLTPSLTNTYQELVSGYRSVNGELEKMSNRRAPRGEQQDYREALEGIYTKHSKVISKLYNNEELTAAEINPLIMEINAQKEYQHSQAKALIVGDPRFRSLADEAKAGQEQLSGFINYGGQ